MASFIHSLSIKQLVSIITCWSLCICVGFSQLSPGKLTKAHTQLEGISNCTACHDLGSKISEQKCLDCHKPLKQKISQNKGYHSSREIKGKACITCHSEHHGVNFEMIRFDKKTFNHSLTGYDLKGSHKINDCTKCHTADNITDPKIRQNKGTYLGLSPTCITCHDDYHQKTLDNDCAKCHNFDKFKPATGFQHSQTQFPLTGAHANVQCIQCHKTEIKNGKEFQNFANVPHKNCNSCHKDPHHGEFGTDCKSCHSTESFSKMKSTSAFNHSLTGFELEGKHKTIDCKKCHDNRSGTKDTYKEFENTQNVTCLTCHEDAHEKKLGQDCKSCHNQQSFGIKNIKSDFDHTLTGYTLYGKHQSVDCRKCHTSTYMTAPLAHDQCKSCHKDYHDGQFEKLVENDCKSCHDETSFLESSFDFNRHEKSNFPLKGAHIATPCFACHKPDNNKWNFRNIGSLCIDCHDNIHDGFISTKFIPNQDCAACHNNDAWTHVAFDHNQTAFSLKGKHETISCRSCHFDETTTPKTQNFIQLDQKCQSCHDNIHGNQFEQDGQTDCARCHGFEKWDRSNFNHDNTRFKLEGAHQKVNCNQCHQSEVKDGKSTILYRNEKLDCKDCHQ